jgi:hypothetical protein
MAALTFIANEAIASVSYKSLAVHLNPSFSL